jgi:nucleoside-diphosphate-sugar epimerase
MSTWEASVPVIEYTDSFSLISCAIPALPNASNTMPLHQRILVTGGSGYIGKEVWRQLITHGFDVTVLTRRPKESDVGMQAAEGEMADLASLERAAVGADAVVHLAAAKSDEHDSYKTNVEGTRNLVAACNKSGVRLIVYVSTASVKLPQLGRYGETKAAAEKVLLASNIPTVILRPSIVYGRGESGIFGSLVRFCRWPLIPVIGNGRCLFRPVHVDDLSAVIENALGNEGARGKTYDVGGDEMISLNALIEKICRDVVGKQRPRIIHIPSSIGIAIARVLSRVMRKPPITVSNILGSTQNIQWDPEPLHRDLNTSLRSLNEGFGEFRHAAMRGEAAVLYRYLYSRSGSPYRSAENFEERYVRALEAHGITGPMHPLLRTAPIFLGPVDAASRMLYPNSLLQSRLAIASALVECDPTSAEWLLPKDRAPARVLVRSALLSLSALAKLVVGLVLSLVPGFIRTHAT